VHTGADDDGGWTLTTFIGGELSAFLALLEACETPAVVVGTSSKSSSSKKLIPKNPKK